MKAHYEKKHSLRKMSVVKPQRERPLGYAILASKSRARNVCARHCEPESLSFLTVLSGKEHFYEGHVPHAGDIVWLATLLLISCYQFSQTACEATLDVAPCFDLKPCL
jgi:hypothetical protein